MRKLYIFSFLLLPISLFAQNYWNQNTQLLPWRMVPSITRVTYADLDRDGDPDVLKAFVNESIPIMWIDDDDDMKKGDVEGDVDSDCLLIDRNKDGVFAGPMDFSIDWADENKNGKADIQLIVSNAGLKVRNYFDWGADFMYVLDEDEDNIMHYVDWNKIMMQAWEHNGHSNFFYDYSGNSTFMKMHASSFRIDDLRYNWENPFIFYDTDNDKLTEMAIRLVDTPNFRDKEGTKNGFDKVDANTDVIFTKKIDYAAITWDLDDDNAAGNEFDFDMSMLFKGKGFSYTDQEHQFKSLKGLKGTDKLFYDKRWRNIDRLYYPDRDTAYSMIFNQGDWQECRLVFDEDDDCNRWERVEFYDPKDVFIVGTEKGGLDHNKQADAAGDRGEFDMDNSGKGQLYVGVFDGRIHLYGAEWGAWRIDQTAFHYQGFGGQYDRWGRKRLQSEPDKFATVKYSDTNNNGFIDLIEHDLDGDKLFEEKVSLLQLGIEDRRGLIATSNTTYADFNKVFNDVAENMWLKAQKAVTLAKKHNISTEWYAFYMQPHSVQEKYNFGYWLNFYLYRDIKHFATATNNTALLKNIDKAYYSGDWNLINEITAADVQQQYKKVGAKKVSPRLFFNNADIERIKALHKKGDKLISIGYNKLQDEAQKILQEPLMEYSLDAAKLRIPSIHRFAIQVPSLAMMYKLTGEKEYADRIWAQLEKMIEYPDWGANRHFLDTGIGAFDFALAYDVLQSYLNDEQKARLKQGVMKHVMLPAKKQLEERVWWSTATHNWNGICNGGIIMAALALYEDDPAMMSKIISLSANRLPNYINAFEPDGQSDEGLKYWGYGLMYTTIALESMQNVLGTTFNLDQAAGFKKAGWFPVYVSGPVVSLSVGDDPLKNSRSGSFFWFARRFNDPALAKLQYDLSIENNTTTWDDMIFYNPKQINGGSVLDKMPTDNYIRGIELMSLRENWKNDAFYVAMHGGSNNANHGHLDAGTFDIQALGEVWAYSNLGSDNYTYPGYFSDKTLPRYKDTPTPQAEPGRWHFYRLRAEGKNCLVINPGTYPDQDEMASAKVIKEKSEANQGLYVADLTECYNRDVLDYRRGILLDRNDRSITVQDDIVAKKPSTIWWSMHTKAAIKLQDGNRSAILQIGDKQLMTRIISPANARFQVLPATYLPGQSFPLTENSSNESFKKLAIKLSDAKETNIRVDFMVPGENQVPNPRIPLSKW